MSDYLRELLDNLNASLAEIQGIADQIRALIPRGKCRAHGCDNQERYTSGYCGLCDIKMKAGGRRLSEVEHDR